MDFFGGYRSPFGYENGEDGELDMAAISPTVQAALNLAKKYPLQNQQSLSQQILGAAKDMFRNYFDMRRDNTVGGDDYFHCKANYEAAQRGKYGKLTAKILGDEKEVFDYFKNRYYK